MIDNPIEELEAVEASNKKEAGENIEGVFLKISDSGISVPDFVKRLDENDILVAIDGNLYLNGQKKLQDAFIPAEGSEDEEAKWLLTFCREGVLFDILLDRPLSSNFDNTSNEETDSVKKIFAEHKFDEFQNYENYEIYKSKYRVCDILSFKKDPLALIFPIIWMSKNQLYPPLCCIVIVYLFAFFLNIYAFLGVVVIISIYVDRAQENLLRSFTMYADKFHYMTIAATNEVDIATILKNIDPNNKIRFEKTKAKKKTSTSISKTLKKQPDAVN